MHVVCQIIRIHDGPDVGILYRRLKRWQVNLTHRPLVNDRVRFMTIKFGIVTHEVLDRRAHSLSLHSLYVSNRNFGGEKGIFAKILEVPAIHRRSVDVHTRPKQEMNAFSTCVATDLDTRSFCKYRIPRRGQCDSTRHRSSRTIVTNTNWSICHFQWRDTQPLDSPDEKTVESTNHVDLFFQGHPAHQSIDPTLNFGGRMCTGCRRLCERRNDNRKQECQNQQ